MPPAASPDPGLTRCQWLSLAAGVTGLAACAVGGALESDQFYRSWLVAWVFWLSLSLGMLGLLLIQSLIWGNWGRATRRILVSGAEVLPLMAVLFLPIFFQPERLYEWARPEAVSQDERLQHKQPYLNEAAFRIRAGVYLAAWVGILVLVRRRPADDREVGRIGNPSYERPTPDAGRIGNPSYERPTRARLEAIPLRGPAVAVLMLTTSFAAFDWMMSLEPHWYSSIYGAIYAGEGLLGGMAAAVLVFVALRRLAGFAEFATPQLFNDLGNLLLAFVMIWGYLEFSQFLIIWSGNLPDEAVWYLKRFEGGWQGVIVAAVVLHLAVPFGLLLSRDIKRHAARLAGVAALLLVMRYVENYWTVMPAFQPRLSVHWLDAAAPVAIGGLWLGMFSFWLGRHVSDIAPGDVEHSGHTESARGQQDGLEIPPAEEHP